MVSEHLALAPLVPIEGHILDEAYFDVLLSAHLHKGEDFSLVDSSHHHAVDLQLDARTKLVHLQDTVNALHDGFEAFPPCHDLKLERVEGIQAQIHSCEARLDHAV